MGRIGIALVVGISLLAAGACGRGDESSPEQAGQPLRGEATHPAAPRGEVQAAEEAGGGGAALIAQGRQMFEQRCVTCHGEEGNGKGPAGAGLQPPPRDLTDPAWQAATSSERIKQVISYGGAAVGLSPIMPAQPDLANDPSKLDALVAYVRTFGGKGGDEQAAAGP